MKNLIIAIILVFMFFAFFIGCGGSGSTEPGSIYGVVTDKVTGEPVKNAGVELIQVGLKSVTGRDGSFEFQDIDLGKYNLLVTKAGYSDTKSSTIIVESGKQVRGDILLEKIPAALRIVDDAGKDISEIDFGAENGDVSRQFNILNDGAEKFEWEISFSADWIESVSKESGELKAGGTQGIIVNIDRSILESGENTTTIHVTSDDGNKQLSVKATNATVLPTLNTLEATDIYTDSAVLNGEIVTSGTPEYTERGFVYSTSSLPAIENTIEHLTVPVIGEAKYSAVAVGLELGTTYYVRAYAINAAGIAYSTNIVSFQTHQVLPKLTTEYPTDISVSNGTATFNGTIEHEGDPVYTERGFVYGHAHNPTVEDDNKKEVTGNGVGAFSIKVTELEINTVYYIRAYAINDAGTGYGDEIMLDFNAVKPIVHTKNATNINIDGGTATFNGEIGSIGDPAYTERGFVYALTHNPTIEDDTKKVVTGNGTGLFSANISELVMSEIYYIRAYATNVFGTSYGEEVELDFNAVMPEVTTNAATSVNIAGGTATLNGKIDNIGDPAYTERGFVYGTVHNPTIEDDTKKIAAGIGTGDFSVNISELVMSEIYYIRAYATNIVGTSYGKEVELDFSAVMPVVTTNAATSINLTAGTATLNGKIDNIGDPAYTERGFVYATIHNPTVEDNTKKIAAGSGAGDFSVNVSDLVLNTTYYIRAYAKNSQGTVYGDEVTLDFNAVPAAVTTNSVLNIDATRATLSATITSIGDPAYTEKGFVYGKNPNPTTLDSKVTVSGSGTGIFTYNLTGLESQVTYYVRAYVISNNNLVYGSEVSFYTESPDYYVLKSVGLMVAKTDAGQGPWSTAIEMCNSSVLAGFTDWRLPTIGELQTVYANKDLIGNFHKDINYDHYWSYTSYECPSTYDYDTTIKCAQYVNFGAGYVGAKDKNNSLYVRCVRTAN